MKRGFVLFLTMSRTLTKDLTGYGCCTEILFSTEFQQILCCDNYANLHSFIRAMLNYSIDKCFFL